MSEAPRPRRVPCRRYGAVAASALALVVTACGAGSPSTSPSAAASGQSSPAVAPTASPASSAALPSATDTSPWVAAGTTVFELHEYFHAVALADGRAVVVGSREADPRAEIWDPATDASRPTQPLNKPRYAFVAVTLRDGRVLVAGGLNEGSPEGEGDKQSFSSAYVFDPRPGREAWTKVGLMDAARTAPSAALLPDGQVLVAGGYYYTGKNEAGSSFGYARATAEVFDPATGDWTSTGSMRYARAGAAAVTLSDGRVLVVGSGAFSVTGLTDNAFDTAEIYDPRTGRFELAGRLPAIDAEAVKALGVELPEGEGAPWTNGTLVALPDGGALLVGNARWWPGEAAVTRTLRFDVWTGSWSEVGQPWATVRSADGATWLTTPGVGRRAALAARMADGRVLIAGGAAGQHAGDVTGSAELFEPATGGSTPLPALPQGRADGEAILLADGSVLLVGGYDRNGFLRTAIRLVP